mgnify:CR=1 FL=1
MAKKNIPSSNHTQVEVQQKNTELHAGIYQAIAVCIHYGRL